MDTKLVVLRNNVNAIIDTILSRENVENSKAFKDSNTLRLEIALSTWLSMAYDCTDEAHARQIVDRALWLLRSNPLSEVITAFKACDDIVINYNNLVQDPDSEFKYQSRVALSSLRPFLTHMCNYVTNIRVFRTFLVFMSHFGYINDDRLASKTYQTFIDNEWKCCLTNESLIWKIAENPQISWSYDGEQYSIDTFSVIRCIQDNLSDLYQTYVSPTPGYVAELPYSGGMCPQLSEYNRTHKTHIRPNSYIKRMIAASNDATFCSTHDIPGKYDEYLDEPVWTYQQGEGLYADISRKVIYGKTFNLNDEQIGLVNRCASLGFSIVDIINKKVLNNGKHDEWLGKQDDLWVDIPEGGSDIGPCSREILPRKCKLNIENKWMRDTGHSLIVAVPKDYKSDRIVGMESPDRNQWMEGIRRRMATSRFMHWFFMQAVTIEDAGESRRYVPFLDLATLDLSNASDLNSTALAGLLLPYHVFADIDTFRSHRWYIRDLRVDGRMEKFLPMGSPVCQEYQSTLYAAILKGCADACYAAHIISKAEYLRCLNTIKVHGDDQIVLAKIAELVMKLEEIFGLKVNREKSHWLPDDHFREACGHHIILANGKAIDVSPVYWPRRGKEVDAEAPLAQVLCSLQHNLYGKDFTTAEETLRNFAAELNVTESLPYKSAGFWAKVPVIRTKPATGRERFDWHYDVVESRVEYVRKEVPLPFYNEEMELYLYEEALRGRNRVYELVRMPDGSYENFCFTYQHRRYYPGGPFQETEIRS